MAESLMDSYTSKKHRVCKSMEEIDVKMEEIDAKKDDRDVKTGKKHRVCKSMEEIDVKMEEIDAKKDDIDVKTGKKRRVCKSREEIDVKMEEIDAKKDDRNLTIFTGRVISFIERLGDGYGWIDRISDCRFDGAHFIQEHIKCDDPDYMGVVKSGQSVEYVLDESTFTVVMVTLPGGVSAPASETNRRNTLPTPSEPTEQNSDGDYLPEEVWNLERLGKDGLLMDSEKQNVKEDTTDKHAYFFGGGLARRNASKENNYADDEKHKGTVTWFSDEEEGYGVLRPESGKYEHQYFLQFFIKCDDPKYMGVLHVGQSVEYVLDEPTNIVLMVTLPGGLPAPASKTALRNPPCDYGYSTFVDDLDDTAASSKKYTISDDKDPTAMAGSNVDKDSTYHIKDDEDISLGHC